MAERDGLASFYVIDIDCLLTWFPNRSISGGLDQVRIRGVGVRHRSDDLFGAAAEEHRLGQGQGDGEPISFGSLVRGFIRVGVDSTIQFEVDIRLEIGSLSRSRHFILEEDRRIPFMINIQFEGDDEILGGTVASLQGVMVTSPRILPGEDPPAF
jgi:hypothetical protein